MEKMKEVADETIILSEAMKLTNGQGVDLVFETAGSKITTQLTAQLVKLGGNVTLVGMAADVIKAVIEFK